MICPNSQQKEAKSQINQDQYSILHNIKYFGIYQIPRWHAKDIPMRTILMIDLKIITNLLKAEHLSFHVIEFFLTIIH